MIVKATLTNLSTFEGLPVLWNPASYGVSRRNRFAAPALVGSGLSPVQHSAGGSARFSTRLFLDSTEKTGAERDLRQLVERLESWSEPEKGHHLPPLVVFGWGAFRFRGYIEELREEWIRFDADGTPVRAWLDLTLRR